MDPFLLLVLNFSPDRFIKYLIGCLALEVVMDNKPLFLLSMPLESLTFSQITPLGLQAACLASLSLCESYVNNTLDYLSLHLQQHFDSSSKGSFEGKPLFVWHYCMLMQFIEQFWCIRTRLLPEKNQQDLVCTKQKALNCKYSRNIWLEEKLLSYIQCMCRILSTSCSVQLLANADMCLMSFLWNISSSNTVSLSGRN